MTATPAVEFVDFDDYCAALRRQTSLTPSEYACLLQQSIAYGEESYSEHLTQYRSECTMFGDAGPGQGADLISLSSMLAAEREALARVRRIIANLGA